MTHLKLSFLGSFQASLDGNTALRFRSDKSRALLAYLAVEAGRSHERATLASLFWPDMPDEDALRNLSQTLSRMRDAIQDHQATPPYLVPSRRDLQWNRASAYELDATKFERWAAGDDTQQLAQAVTLYQGEFLRGFGLPDCADFETWLLLKREHYQQLALEAMRKLAAHHLARADYAQAQHYARLQLGLETWRETAHRQLMRALALNGHRSEALAQYEACRRILAEELGVEPEAETTALYEQVRLGAFGQVDASAPRKTVEWSEVPDLGKFHGRVGELEQLEEWVMRDQCRLLAVVGMGGMGKTALAARLTQRLTDSFDVVIWRSVLNAPSLSEVLRAWLHTLSDQHVAALPARLDEQLDALVHHMQQRRCLLVLDNLESIFEAGSAAIAYRPEYADYGQLLQRVGQSRHQSCLIFTSRERPAELSRLEGTTAPARSLRLSGLADEAARALLNERGLTGLDAQTSELVSHYSGNPLALKLVAETIRDLFANDINAFLRDETPIFDDIRIVLDQQFERLSLLEREILIWLAIEREPVSVQTIQADLTHHLSRWEVLESVRALQRRSLLEISGVGFALHNVVIEYVTGRLIEQVCREIEQERPDVLTSHALQKANAREYVRESQAHLILHPIAQWLMTHLNSERIRAAFVRMLDHMRTAPPNASGYAAGNLLNLLAYTKLDARGYDFSGLDVRQAYLRGALLRGVNFTGANLAGAAFSNKFGGVNALAFSPDGQTLAMAPSEGLIWLRSVVDGQPVAVLSGHTSIVWSVAFSPDGRYLASASDDATVRLWDVQSAKALHIWRAHSSFVHAVAFSPDGQVVASAGVDEVIRLWDVHSGESRGALLGHAGDVHALSFSPDETRIASAGVDRTVRVWDANSGASLFVLLGHADEVDAVAFSPDGKVLASGSKDHTIRLWDAQTGEALQVLQGQDRSNSVGTVAFSPEGRLLASGGADQNIRVWDARTGEALHVLQGHSSWVGAVAFSPDGQLLASGSEDQSVRLWDARTYRTLYVLSGYLQWVDTVAFSHSGRWLASGGHDRTVRLWDMQTKTIARELYGHTSWVSCVTFSPDDTLLASTSEDHTIRVWDLERGSERHILTGHEFAVESVAFSSDGQWLASCSGDTTVRLWNVATGKLISVLRGHTRGLEAVAFSPDGQLIASAGWDHLIVLWEAHSGKVKRVLRGHDDHVASVAFSPDGSRLVSAGTDRTIRLWDVASGQAECILQGHTHWIRWVMFSQDGAQVISASGDGTVRVWDVATRQNARVLRGHTNVVVSAALSSDGHTLASSSRDETIRLWELASGVCTAVLQPEGPYAGTVITGVTGLTEAQKDALKSLGAVENVPR